MGYEVKRADDLFSDIEICRTPEEMKTYYESMRDNVKSDTEYSNMARSKKGLFKEFLEEFYPLYCFSQSRFCDKESKLKIVLGNQGYDAILINPEGKEIKLEFTSYIDGKWKYEDALTINSRGYGNIRFSDHKDLSSRSLDYLEKILLNVKNKSDKSYVGISIVFIVNTFDYFEVYNNDSQQFVNLIMYEIGKINFRSDTIYLMVMNDKNISEIDNNLYVIK